MKEEVLHTTAYKFTIQKDDITVGRASLFLITNEGHEEPYGLLEDVFVKEEYQQQGIGTKLVNTVIEKAKEKRCYKLLATSRNTRKNVHAWYEKLGFEKYGAAFRMDF